MEAAKGLLWVRQYLEGWVGQDLTLSWDLYLPPNRDHIGVVLGEVEWAKGTRLRQKWRGGMT